jgi:uncharacterized membrane protein (TIGR02234 family)
VNARRLFVPVVLATLAAGGLAFFAAGRTWAHVVVATPGLPKDPVDVSGSDAQPLVAALALVVVTSALAVLASSPRVRRGVGVFTVLVALAGIVVVVTGGSSLEDSVTRAVRDSAAFTSTMPGYDTSLWRIVTVAAFVLAAAFGAMTAWWGPRWPTMGSRYDAPSAHPETVAPQSDADMWKALDEGRDPTQ